MYEYQMIFITKAWHSRGQRFDPAYLHQKHSISLEIECSSILFSLFCAGHFPLGQQTFSISSFLTAERKKLWHLSKKKEQEANVFHTRFACVWDVMKTAGKFQRQCVGILLRIWPLQRQGKKRSGWRRFASSMLQLFRYIILSVACLSFSMPLMK